MRFYTVEKLGERMQKTPEGFLLCFDVPIARTGQMLYGPDETPIAVGPDGITRIERTAEEVFRDATIASFNGKSVVNDHPDNEEGAVFPKNWKDLTVGVVLDPRRGKGALDDLLFADLLITDEDAIEDVMSGKREVSCGYDADYMETGAGRGYQKNIVGNHVALVEKGRCGVRCSIGDSKRGEIKMTFKDKILAAFKNSKDETSLMAAMSALPASVLTHDDEGGGGVHFHIGGTPGNGGSASAPSKDDRKWNDKALDDKFEEMKTSHDAFTAKYANDTKSIMDSLEELKSGKKTEGDADPTGETKAIEGALEEEAPVGTGDRARKATDSQYLGESFQETIALAEVITPGIHVPTFDSAAKPVKTFRDICALRAKALELGNSDPAVNAMILKARGGRELVTDSLKKMPCSEVKTLFFAVGAMKKAANAADATKGSKDNGNGNRGTAAAAGGSPMSIAELNKKNADFYARK